MNQQSLNLGPPPLNEVIRRHISYLASQNHYRRRQGLTYLLNILNAPRGTDLEIRDFLPHVLDLLLEVSDDVRDKAVKVVVKLTPDQAEEFLEEMLPFIRAGMTHLAANVATSSLDLLGWLIASCGGRLVSCRGGWVKTLKCFLVMMRWTAESRTSGWTFSRSSIGDGTCHAVSLIKCLIMLEMFLRAGLARPRRDRRPMTQMADFPLAGTLGALLPRGPIISFACLDLFGEPIDRENAECNDVSTRKRILVENFLPALEQGLAALLSDGGHVGRYAAAAAETLRKGMANVLGYANDPEGGDLDDSDSVPMDLDHGSNRRRSAIIPGYWTQYDGAQDEATS